MSWDLRAHVLTLFRARHTAPDAVQRVKSRYVAAASHSSARGSCASRAAVRHMAFSLAVEWAKKGVRVNCLR